MDTLYKSLVSEKLEIARSRKQNGTEVHVYVNTHNT